MSRQNIQNKCGVKLLALMMEALHTYVISLYFSYTALYPRRLSTPISVLL
jgi:hypothetical protein